MEFSLRRKRLAVPELWPSPRSLSPHVIRHCLPCVPPWPRLHTLSAMCPPCVRRLYALCPSCVRLECAWPRLQILSALCPPVCARPRLLTLSAMCPRGFPPCVRLASALAPPPNLACHLSATCPPCFCLQTLHAICQSCDRLAATTCPPSKPCPPHVSALCPPSCASSGPPCMCPRLWTLSARGLLWGRAVASRKKILLSIAQPAAFIWHARWSVSLAFIWLPKFRPLQAHPMLEKLFGVYAVIILVHSRFMIFMKHRAKGVFPRGQASTPGLKL